LAKSINVLGVYALGVNALGVYALGIYALGVNALGVNALGVNALGIYALGVYKSYISNENGIGGTHIRLQEHRCYLIYYKLKTCNSYW